MTGQEPAPTPALPDEGMRARGRRRSLLLPAVLSIVCMNIALRYPFADTLVGIDTFYVTGLAVSITQLGRIGWYTHPLSYFGLTSESEPPAVPLLLSATSQLGGANIVAANYLFTSILAVVGALGAFCLGHKLRGTLSAGLLTAIAYSLAPRFVGFTLNQSSNRDLFLAVLPFVLVLLMIIARGRSRLWTALFLLEVVVLVLLVAHPVAVLLGAAAVAHLAAPRASKLLNYRGIPKIARVLGFFAGVLGLVGLQVYQLLPAPFLLQNQYSSGELFAGADPAVTLVNMSIDFAQGIGVLAPLAILGIVTALGRPRVRASEVFLLLLILVMAPAMVLGYYVILILLAPLCAFLVLGVERLGAGPTATSTRKGVAFCLVAALTLASSAAMVGVWGVRSTSLAPSTIDAAHYLSGAPFGYFVSDDPLDTSYRIWTMSGRPPLAWSKLPLLIYGAAAPDESESLDVRDIVSSVLNGAITDTVSQHTLDAYLVRFFVEDVTMGEGGRFTRSPFGWSLEDHAYVCFENDRYRVWHL